MPNDRRSAERKTVNLSVRWYGLTGTYEARLEDVSMAGCFVNTTGRVDLNDRLSLEVELPSGAWLELRGQVASYQPGIGFGMQFLALTEEEEEALKALLT